MEVFKIRFIESFFSLIEQKIKKILEIKNQKEQGIS